MGTEITTALIAFGGVIIGLGASFLMQALQRKWTLDDQRREWIRAELEDYSETYKGMADTFSKASFFDVHDVFKASSDIYKSLMDIEINPPPFTDSILDDLYDQISSENHKLLEYAREEPEDKKISEGIALNIFDLVTQVQKRINDMIDETYK